MSRRLVVAGAVCVCVLIWIKRRKPCLRDVGWLYGELGFWKDVHKNALMWSSNNPPDRQKLTVDFVNHTDITLFMSWIAPDGTLRHVRRMNPEHGRYAIKDGSVKNLHREMTSTGHSFVVYHDPLSTFSSSPSTLSDLCERNQVVCVYRPTKLNDAQDGHVVHIHRQQQDEEKEERKQYDEEEDRSRKRNWTVSFTFRSMGPALIDTSKYVYDAIELEGVKLHVREGLELSGALYAALCEDLRMCARVLPSKLLTVCHLWINESLTYGRGVEGRHCCFHPSPDWLIEQGCDPAKAGCVEIYSTADYLQSRSDWGVGGLLLHEFSHGFHHHCVPLGYENKEIRLVYDAAMSEGLYDAVKVHGPQGAKGPIRAYACSNQMEYWAELSVAFHCDSDEEFNKWFPFNRAQVRSHDPRGFAVLDRFWNETLSLL